ncbi:MAG: hypothetical protein GX631_02335 [Dehalococcoidales bacterium]|jgi:hypothetical protein|nr:hypothetical protein [Dehalococcoidales bacterium]
MDQIAYCNDLLTRFEEIFYHELSQINARCKVELIGSDFLNDKNITGNTVEELVENCIKAIKAEGFVKEMTGKVAGRGILLKLNMKGCIHLPKEAKLQAEGIEPYLCPLANMISEQIISKLNYMTTYSAGMHVDSAKGECSIYCAIYKDMDDIGKVSDWTKE